MTVATIDDVFAEQLADLRSAETQLVEALPRVAAAAHEEKLREAIEEHLEETRGHVERLDRIIGPLNRPVPTRECKGMKGLIAEGEEIAAEQPGAGQGRRDHRRRPAGRTLRDRGLRHREGPGGRTRLRRGPQPAR